MNFFKYENPLFLVKDLISAKQDKNEELVNNINDGLIDLKKADNKKQIPENENPKKVVNIVEKILNFNKRQKGKKLPLDLACVGRVAKASDRKVFNCMEHKLVTHKITNTTCTSKSR